MSIAVIPHQRSSYPPHQTEVAITTHFAKIKIVNGSEEYSPNWYIYNATHIPKAQGIKRKRKWRYCRSQKTRFPTLIDLVISRDNRDTTPMESQQRR